ncbi:hypothetical protein ECTX1999_5398 [Escherichia coli TX1999]|nr:hypothetical protein ECTX1999_5398 [Escherichia coli TX1999]
MKLNHINIPELLTIKHMLKKRKNKLQLRLVWHGGNGFVINDIAPSNNIIWSSPNGWKHCD